MNILQKYITMSLVVITLVALFGLVMLFSFFSMIDQISDTGTGSYDVAEAVLYVFLTTPKLAYELFPIAAVIGSMTTLGILAQNSELVVIRTSGVSRIKLALILSKAAIFLVLLSVLIGEFIAPVSEEAAQYRRSMAMLDQIAVRAQGYWTRDGDSFINIRRILPGDHVKDVYIYEFDKDNKLRNSFYAKEASYESGRWLLKDIEKTSFTDEKIMSEKFRMAEWPSLLDPEIINFEIVKPQYLTFIGLMKYISYLKKNAQETTPYVQALWGKIIKPLTILAMILLAILLVQSESRFTPVGQRVFFGSMVGIIFHICDQISGHMGIVYDIHPAISVTLPTVILLSSVFYLIRE